MHQMQTLGASPLLITPQHSPLPPNTLNILQLTAGGIKTKHTEISDFLHEHNIHITLIQETKLKPNTRLTAFTNYTTLRLHTHNHSNMNSSHCSTKISSSQTGHNSSDT